MISLRKRIKDAALNQITDDADLFKRIDLSYTTPRGVHLRIYNKSEWVIYNDVFVEGEYDPAISLALDYVAESHIRPFVLDLGANVGYFSLRFADSWLKRFPDDPRGFDVLGVEGSPSVFEKLKTRIAGQPHLNGNARFVHGLVGQRDGYGEISETGFDSMNSILKTSGHRARVEFLDLEKVLPPPDREITLLKCDVEGAEELLLENNPGLLRRTRFAVFEQHPDLCNTARVRELIDTAGLTRVDAGVAANVEVYKAS